MKILTLDKKTFEILPTFEAMDDEILQDLAGSMLHRLGGSHSMNEEVNFILAMEHTPDLPTSVPFTGDDITNNAPTANIETKDAWEDLTESQRDDLVSKLTDALEQESDPEEIVKLEDLIEDAGEHEFETYPEVYQWFLLDSRLISRLDDLGECTLNGVYWGRTCCGQAFTMDHCVKQACYDMAKIWAKGSN